MNKPALRRLRAPLPLIASVCLLFVALTVLSSLMMPKNNQASFGQHDVGAHGVLGEPQNSLDVLFVGDSEVYTSLIPRQMWSEHGFTSYDVSTSAQKLPYAYSLLQRALARQQPRVVVLETNMLFRRVDVDDALWRTLADALPVLEYHNRWKSLRPVDISAPVKTTWTDPSKGANLSDATVPSSTSGYMKPSQERAAVARLNRWYLERIVDLCQSQGAEVVLLSTPSTKNWNWERHNAVEALIAEHANWNHVTYLDLNLHREEVPIDWSCESRDGGDHLNRSGAEKVSRFVGAWLDERYQLPDHRDDPSYRTWM